MVCFGFVDSHAMFSSLSTLRLDNYLYTEPELAKWAGRIRKIAEKAETTFVVANNHFQGKAAVNGLQLKHQLTGKKVKAPAVLVEHYPQLKEISDVA